MRDQQVVCDTTSYYNGWDQWSALRDMEERIKALEALIGAPE